jgi:hypothetical protein
MGNLCEWYNGETIKSETATNLHNKLENLQLHAEISGSEYVNRFMAWYCDLEKIKGEGMPASHVVSVFLKNITDTGFQTTVTYCLNSNTGLENCVNAICKQVRDIQQKKLAHHQLKATLRQMRNKNDHSKDDDSVESAKKRLKNNKARRVNSNQGKTENCKFEGELDTKEKGLLRFDSECWKKMEDAEKEFVRDYNANIKHGDPMDKMSKGYFSEEQDPSNKDY